MISLVKITNEAYRVRWDLTNDPIPAVGRLVAAKNDSAAFQIVLQSDCQYSVAVRPVEWFSYKTALRGPHQRIRVEVTSCFEKELCLEGMMTDQDDAKKADVLLTQDVLECPANFPTGVWAEIKIPKDALAGEYLVKVRVFSSFYGEDEELVFCDEIPLTVSDYVLPEPKARLLYLNLWQHLSSIARYHDTPLWSDEHFAVIEEYVKALAALGQKSVTLCAGEIPWGGQGCAVDREHNSNLFEYSIIPITKKEDGSFFYDFGIMQRYIDLCTKAGITGDIEIFGLVNVWQKLIPAPLCEDYPENIVLRYFDQASGAVKYIRSSDEVIAYIKALEKYFIDTLQITRVRIGADEPSDIERYRKSLELLKEIAPSFKCSTAINHAEFIEEFQDRIHTAAPYLSCVNKEYDTLKKHKAQFPDKKLLYYVCGYHGIPNNCISNPLTDNRCIGLLVDYLGMDGFLRWNFCLFSDEPRTDIRFSHFGTGDMNFVYPAKNGKVLLSLRYKLLQRGFVDHELLSSLRQKDPESAERLLSKVFKFSKDDLLDFDIRRRASHGKVDAARNENDLVSRNYDDYNELKASALELLK